MRKISFLTLMALMVTACPQNGDDTGDSGDSGTPPEIVLTFGSGTADYSVDIDGTTVCDSSYSLTGSEYENGFFDNADFMFSVSASESANSHTADCPNPDPWRYTFSTPYPTAYPDDKAGMGYTTHWYYAGYGYLPAYEMFFSFYHYGPYIYSYTIMSARIEGSSGTVYAPGTFSDADGSVSWTYDPDPVYNAQIAEFRNCTDDYISRVALQDYPDDFDGDAVAAEDDPDTTATEGPEATGLDFVADAGGGASVAGTIADCSEEDKADSYTITVPASSTAQLSVDVDTTKGFDPFMWVNNSDGCTVKYSDDMYNCNGDTELCSYVDGDGATQTFSCCPSLEVENTTGSAATYTVWVSVAFGDTCEDSGDVAGYTLKYAGLGGAPTADEDDYAPKYELSASGSATYTATEVR